MIKNRHVPLISCKNETSNSGILIGSPSSEDLMAKDSLAGGPSLRVTDDTAGQGGAQSCLLDKNSFAKATQYSCRKAKT